jgi:hypothetical protein
MLVPELKSDNKAARSVAGRKIEVLPTVLSIGTCASVCIVTITSIYSGSYSEAWILLCAVLIMDSLRNFVEFLEARGMIGASRGHNKILFSILWVVGIVAIWWVGRATVSVEITGDFRIMGLVLFALITLSLINWFCKINLAGEEKDNP